MAELTGLLRQMEEDDTSAEALHVFARRLLAEETTRFAVQLTKVLQPTPITYIYIIDTILSKDLDPLVHAGGGGEGWSA